MVCLVSLDRLPPRHPNRPRRHSSSLVNCQQYQPKCLAQHFHQIWWSYLVQQAIFMPFLSHHLLWFHQLCHLCSVNARWRRKSSKVLVRTIRLQNLFVFLAYTFTILLCGNCSTLRKRPKNCCWYLYAEREIIHHRGPAPGCMHDFFGHTHSNK